MLVTEVFLVTLLLLLPVDGARERPWCTGGSALCSAVTQESTYQHTSVTAGNGLVYTLGGRKGGGQDEIFIPDQLYELEPKTLVLRSQPLSGWQEVQGRAAHSMIEWVDGLGRRHLVVFGGVAYRPSDQATSQEIVLNDVASVSLQTFAWSPHKSTGTAPDPRKFASAAVWRSDMMLVYGGQLANDSWSNELWAYNLTDRRWMGQVYNVTSDSAPSARGYAGLAVYGDLLLLYGGYLRKFVSVLAPSPPSPPPGLPVGPNPTSGSSPSSSPNSNPTNSPPSSTNSPAGSSGGPTPPSTGNCSLSANSTLSSNCTANAPNVPAPQSNGSVPPSSSIQSPSITATPPATGTPGSGNSPLTPPTAGRGPPNPQPPSSWQGAPPSDPPSPSPPTQSQALAPPPSQVLPAPPLASRMQPASQGGRRRGLSQGSGFSPAAPTPPPPRQPPSPETPAPTPTSAPPPVYLTMKKYVVYKDLWLLDLRPLVATNDVTNITTGSGSGSVLRTNSTLWIQTKIDTAPNETYVSMAAFDVSLRLSQESGTLVVYASGAVKPYGYDLESYWRQWYARYTISNLSDAITQIDQGARTVTLFLQRRGMFQHPDLASSPTSSCCWVNVDDSPVDLESGSGIVTFEAGLLSTPFVREQTLAVTADGGMIVHGGQREADDFPIAIPTSRRLLLRWSNGGVLALSSASLKHSYFMSSSSSVIMRSMHAIQLPSPLSSNVTTDDSSTSTSTGIIYFGKRDTSVVSVPELSFVILSNTSAFEEIGTCETGSGQCGSLNVSGSTDSAPKRDAYASAPFLVPYTGRKYGSSDPFQVKTPLVLIYGGYETTSGAVTSTSSDTSTPWLALQIKTALIACDTTNTLTSTQWATYATCAYNKLNVTCTSGSSSSPSSSPSSSSSTGSAGPAPSTGRRHLYTRLQHQQSGGESYLEEYEATRQIVDIYDQGDDYDNLSADYNSHGTRSSGGSSRRFRSHGIRGGARRLAATGAIDTTAKKYFNSALLVAWQDASWQPLTAQSVGSQRILYDVVANLQGGTTHSPGPRVASTMSAISDQAALLFGGYTFDYTAAMDDGSVTSNELLLANDVHYIRVYAGGDAVNFTSYGAAQCPSGASCTPASPVQWNPEQPLPQVAPLRQPRVSELPNSVNNFSCAGGTSVLVEAMMSLSESSSSSLGLTITTWSGNVLFNLDRIVSVLDGTVVSPLSVISITTIELPKGLIQVWMTSAEGRGWTQDEDYTTTRASCCKSDAVPGEPESQCCPQIRLSSVSCGKGKTYLQGFGPGEATFDVGSSNRAASRSNMTFFQYRKGYGLLVQPSPEALPIGEAASYTQFPLEQAGCYLHTFELQPQISSLRPTPRCRHASVFLNTTDIEKVYGPNGILVVHGGSSTISVSNATTRLSDLWVFFLSNNTWAQLKAIGTLPPALIDHAMVAVGTQIYLGGGEYFNTTSRAFQQDSTVYLLDLGLPTLYWRKLSGGSTLYTGGTSSTSSYYSLAYVPELNRLAFSTPKDLLFIPITSRSSVSTSNTSNNSGAGTNSNDSVPAPSLTSIDSSVISPLLSSLYDGDTLMLSELSSITVAPGHPMSVYAAILIQGRYAPPPTGAGASQHRQLLQGSLLGPDPDPDPEALPGPDAAPSDSTGSSSREEDLKFSGTVYRLSLTEDKEISLRHEPRHNRDSRSHSHLLQSRPRSSQHQQHSNSVPWGSAVSSRQVVEHAKDINNTDNGEADGQGVDRGRVGGRRLRVTSAPPGSPPPVPPVPPVPSPASTSLEDLLSQYLSGTGLTEIDCSGADRAMTIVSGGVLIENLLFRNCRDTAVVVESLSGSQPVRFANCVFFNNSGTLGGALRVGSGAKVVIESSLFLGNDASQGGALFVEGGGLVINVTRSTFTRNGNGNRPGNRQGGAVYGDSGSCLQSFATCQFHSNGDLSTTTTTTSSSSSNSSSNSTALGGGMLLVRPSCGCSVIDSSFTLNKAAVGGGLAVSELDSTLEFTLTATNFTGNVAFSKAGALSLDYVYGSVSMTGCRFESNWARYRGGAVFSSSTRVARASGCDFLTNTAALSTGGAWSAEKEGTITMEGGRVAGNFAKYGGGLSLNRDLTLLASNVFFEENSAQYAGALESLDCSLLNITSCSFTSNSAYAAGALSIFKASLGADILNCNFTSNMAASNASATDACGRSGSGGGGAVCLDIAGSVRLLGGTFANNSATNGGAIWASQSCNPFTDDQCGHVLLLNTRLYENAAVGGGGGGLFVYEADDLNVSCTGDESMLLDAITFAAAADIAANGTACNGSWYGNTALYGALIASTAMSMHVLTPLNSSISEYRSNDLLVVTVELRDSFGQRISGGSPETTTVFNAAGNSIQPTGVLTARASEGVANFTALRVRASPDAYTFNISAYGTIHDILDAVVSVEVRRCVVGEVTNAEKDMCTPCAAGTYSYNPQNTSCDRCPENARCSDTGTGGFVILPEDGYWRSGPYSPQVISCPNADSCSYDGATMTAAVPGIVKARDVALLDALMKIGGGGSGTHFVMNNSHTAVEWYRALQCREGYFGNVCGGCAEGYGQTRDATCAKCPNRSLNALFYFLVSLINVLMIVITVRAQLVKGKEVRRKPNSAKDSEATATAPRSTTTKDGAKDAASGSILPDAPGDGSCGEKAPEAGECGGSSKGDKAAQSVHDDPKAAAAKESPPPSCGPDSAQLTSPFEDDMRDDELESGTPSIVLKILVSYLQVVSIVKDVALVWPSPVEWLLKLEMQVSFGITTLVSLDCSLPSTGVPKSVARVLVTVTTPFIMVILAVPVWVLLYPAHVLARQKKGLSPLDRRRYIKVRVIMTAITIVFFTYPTVTNVLLSIFSCPLLDDLPTRGTPYGDQLYSVGRYWGKDYNLRCYHGVHRLMMLILGVPGVLLFSVGVPAFSSWFLWYNRKRLRRRNFFRAYGFLYSDYEDRCYVWESAIMLRKLVIVAVVVFLGAISVQVQLLVSLGVIIVAIAAQIWYDPYRCPRMDALERISLYGTATLIYISLFFLLDLGDVMGLILTVLLLGLNGLILAWFVIVMIREIVRLIMRGLDAGEDGVVTSQDVMNVLEVMAVKRPWLAKRILNLDQLVRKHPSAARFLSYAYPYGETTDPWVRAHLALDPDFNLEPEPEPEPEPKDPRPNQTRQNERPGKDRRQGSQDGFAEISGMAPEGARSQVEIRALPSAHQMGLEEVPTPKAAAAAAATGAASSGAVVCPTVMASSGDSSSRLACVSSVVLVPSNAASVSRRTSISALTAPVVTPTATRNAPVLLGAESATPEAAGGAGKGAGADTYRPSLPGMTQTGQMPTTPSSVATPPAASVVSAPGSRPGSRGLSDSGRLTRLEGRIRVFPQPLQDQSPPAGQGLPPWKVATTDDSVGGQQLNRTQPPNASAQDPTERHIGGMNGAMVGSRPGSAAGDSSGVGNSRRSLSAWGAKSQSPGERDWAAGREGVQQP